MVQTQRDKDICPSLTKFFNDFIFPISGGKSVNLLLLAASRVNFPIETIDAGKD